MPELLIFQAGEYPQGSWPVERVTSMVKSYDPENDIEAPAVIGHRIADTDEAQYAHGWVKSLRVDEKGNVYAVFDEFSQDLKTAIALKKLRYVSAEIFEFDKEDPKQSPYLSAVAFLGRDNPAVPATKIRTSFFSKGCSYTPATDENHTARFTRRLSRDDITLFTQISQKESKEEIQMAKTEEGAAGKEAGDAASKAAFDAQAAELARFRKENEDLKAGAKKDEATRFYTALRDGGKLPPAHFDRIVSFDTRMGSEDQKEFREILSTFGVILDLSGEHQADKKRAGTVPPGGTDALSATIRAYQKERNLATFGEAATALYAEKPELFKEEA